MDFKDHKSIFLQIADSTCDKIVNGVFSAGDKITSVRELAGNLGVNHNTIMRAYLELQTKGIIDQKRGMGNFVTPDARDIILQERRKEFFHKVLPEFKRQAQLLGISIDELQKHLNKK